MSEAKAAALLARLRAAGINPVLDPDGGLALPSGAVLVKADVRELNRHAAAVRRILIMEARLGRVAACPPPPTARPASATDSGRRAVQEARRRLQQTAPDELAALDAATRDTDPEVAAAARSVLARLMAAALKATPPARNMG